MTTTPYMKLSAGELSLSRSHRRLRILIVKDSEANLTLAKIRLEQQGHEIMIALNGREAIEAFKKGGPDIILMDVNMPGKKELPGKALDLPRLKEILQEMLKVFEHYSPDVLELFLAELKEYLSQDQLNSIVKHVKYFEFDRAKEATLNLAMTLDIDMEKYHG